MTWWFCTPFVLNNWGHGTWQKGGIGKNYWKTWSIKKSSSDGVAPSGEKRTLIWGYRPRVLVWRFHQHSKITPSSFHGSLEIYSENILFFFLMNEVPKNEVF